MSKIVVDTIESSGTTVTVSDNLDAGANAVTAGSITGLTATSLTSGTLAAARLPATGVDASSLTTGALPNARLAAGTIIQIVTATPHTTAQSWASGTGGWTAIGTGCEVVITPSSTDSKILVIYSIGGISSNNGNAPATRIYRSISGGTASAPLVATSVGSRQAAMTCSPGYVGGDVSSGQIVWDSGHHFLDSPSASTAITYALQWGGRTDTGTFTNYVGRGVSDADGDYVARGVTTLTVMELKA